MKITTVVWQLMLVGTLKAVHGWRLTVSYHTITMSYVGLL